MVVTARKAGVPADVSESARLRILDTVGICIAATALPTSKMMMSYASAQGGRAEASAIGVPSRLPASMAALINGTLAHSLDFDDTHLPSVLHPSATVVPVCLAVGELAGVAGAQLLAAVSAGLEISVRLGMAGYEPSSRSSVFFDRGQHATSICGAVAGAAAAASLLGLEQSQVTHAMAIAASTASGILEGNRMGGTVKRIHCGWAAHSAIVAAGLARAGITGPPTVLEGRFGFFQAFLGERVDLDVVAAGLGDVWSVPSIHFKPYPANHFTHTAIDAAGALRRRGIQASDLTALRLRVPGPVVRTIGEPIERKRHPQTGYEAQFSGPFAVAAGLLGGGGLGVDLEDFTDELARDAQRQSIMELVEVIDDDEMTALFPHEFPAILEATLRDGSIIVERVLANRGGPRRPLTRDELTTKFLGNASRVVAADVAKAVAAGIEQLPRATRVADLLSPLLRIP